jgi:putative ABC transport system permease protein
MSFIDAARHRLRVLFRSDAYARELDEEMRFHLSLDAQQQASRDARHAARRRFGNVTYYKEETRHMAGLSFFDVARQDLKFALRSFRHSPGFTAVVVLTLAIGIGANTAIFSAVDAMLLRPLPFREPDRLMAVSMVVPARGENPARDDIPWSYPKFAAFREAQTAFADVTASSDNEVTVRANGDAERDRSDVIDSHYLPTLGVQPALGRNLLPEEDSHPGGPRVVILGDAIWRRLYNADPTVLGKTLDIDGQPFTIVGVTPPTFKGVSGRAELFTPVLAAPADEINQAWSHFLNVVGRLKPGVSAAAANADVQRVGAIVDRKYPHPQIKDEHWSALARPLDATRVAPLVRRSLLVLLGAVGLVLLIACANVANLFLVRAEGRRREIAVRLAIGAERRRLVRQLLTESIVLSILGGVASIVIAWAGVHLLSRLVPSSLVQPRFGGVAGVSADAIHLDWSALVFAGVVTVATGILFGLVPAIQSTRPTLTDALKDGITLAQGGSLRRLTTRHVLAMAEISLAIILLAGSGLFLRSLGNLLGVNLGFKADHVLTMRLNTPSNFGRDSLAPFYDELTARLAALPGVTDVGLTDCQPLSGGCNGTVMWFRDRPPVARGTEPDVGAHWVSPDWHKTMRIPLIAGRFFTRDDRVGSRKVILVNETAAKRFWPGQSALGKPVSIGQGGFDTDTAYVIGVVGDVRYRSLDSLPKPDAYVSYYQSPRGRMMVFVRTNGDPAAMTMAARRAIHALAPGVPVYDVMTMPQRVDTAAAAARFRAVLLSIFAAMALVLATIGTYGVIAYGVAQRTREIGIRVALGAQSGDVVRLVVRQGLVLAMVGGLVGVLVALASSRVLKSLLYDVKSSDPVTFVGIVVVLVAAVLVASWIPARRAAGVQPLEALREG